MSRLSTLVRGLCNAKGIKMKELAAKMGVSPVSLSRTLAKDTPKPTTLSKIAIALDMSTRDIFRMYHDDSLYLQQDDDVNIIPDAEGVPTSEKTPKLISIVSKEPNSISTLPTTKENDTISAHAEFAYEGNMLIADTFLDAALLINNLSALEQRRTTEGKDAIYQSMLSVLIKQYGKNEKE